MEWLLAEAALIDLTGPDEVTPLVIAILSGQVDVIGWLLARRADDGIQCNDDEHPASWPTALDYAIADVDIARQDERQHDERIWRLLRSHRQAPDGTRSDDRPDW